MRWLYGDDLTADGFPACAGQHAIEDGAAEGDILLLGWECACPQLPSDDRFVATDRRLDQRSFPVAGRGLPLHSAVGVDRGYMTGSLPGGIGVLPFHHIGAWRNDHRFVRTVIGNGVIGRIAIIGAICGELTNRYVNLVEQRSTCEALPARCSVMTCAMMSPVSASSIRCSLRQPLRDLTP